MKTDTWKNLSKESGKQLQEMASSIGVRQNAFSLRMNRDTIKDDERKRIAESLGAVYVCGFLLLNGEFISDYGDAIGVNLTDDKAEIIVSTLNNRKSQQVYTNSGSGDAPTQQNPPFSQLASSNPTQNPSPKK